MSDLRAGAALEKVLLSISGKSLCVLDIGCGAGDHSRAMQDAMGGGGRTIAVDSGTPPPDDCAFSTIHDDIFRPNPYRLTGTHLIWCSHVLEHLPDVGVALSKMRDLLAPDGWLVITVPPLKHSIVGGHVNLFNMGLLAYRLILAGFDCSRGHFLRDGYDLSACVQRSAEVPREVLNHLRHDQGDIEILAPYFPAGWRVRERFDGENLCPVNWDHEGEVVKLRFCS